jgi:3',5'-cyclic AMP phosphodiesterase CpdA
MRNDADRNRREFLKAAVTGGAALAFSWRGRAAFAAPGELHLALLSDTHVPADRANGHRGMTPWQNLKAALPGIAASSPAGLVLCGDAARLDGQPGDYRELRGLVAPLGLPLHVALGNHDDRAAFRAVFDQPPGRLAPVEGRHVTILEHEALRIVLLDSLLYVNRVAGLLGRAQREWLSAWLPTVADRPVVLFVHHPPTESDGDLLDGDRLLAVLSANPHVKALVHGHAHVWSLGRRGALHVVGLPALGYNFDDAQPVGWVDARFRRDGVALTLRAVAGSRAQDGTTTSLAWS